MTLIEWYIISLFVLSSFFSCCFIWTVATGNANYETINPVHINIMNWLCSVSWGFQASSKDFPCLCEISGTPIPTASLPITRSCFAQECWSGFTNQEIRIIVYAYIQKRRWEWWTWWCWLRRRSKKIIICRAGRQLCHSFVVEEG